MNPFEVPSLSHTARRKLGALIAEGHQICGVAIQRENANGSVTRGAVSAGGMVLWWHPQPVPQHRAPHISKDSNPMNTATPAAALCDCTSLCGDDPRLETGKVPACEHRARLLADVRAREVLVWFSINPETMPDALELVLIEREDDGVNEPTWPGYWDGEQWMDVDGDLFPGKPVAWCTWPGGRKGERFHG